MGNISTKMPTVLVTSLLPGGGPPHDTTMSATCHPPPKPMDPEDDDSTANVILRILSKHVNTIEAGMKNHEYRTYQLCKGVKYVWLYKDNIEAIRSAYSSPTTLQDRLPTDTTTNSG